jgi:hypothetical protein
MLISRAFPPVSEPSSNAGSRARAAWIATFLAAAVAVALLASARGASSRRPFQPPPEFGGQRWAVVTDAAQAVRVWDAAGVYGRRLVVVTGRWAAIRSTYLDQRIRENPNPKDPLDVVDVQAALLFASQSGIARELTVVMPPAALARRLAEIAPAKELRAEGGCAVLPFPGFVRRFCPPEAVPQSEEPVLLLVEPSFFGEGAPGAAEAFIRQRGADADLALVCAADPEAGPAEQERAAAFALAVGAVNVEARP